MGVPRHTVSASGRIGPQRQKSRTHRANSGPDDTSGLPVHGQVRGRYMPPARRVPHSTGRSFRAVRPKGRPGGTAERHPAGAVVPRTSRNATPLATPVRRSRTGPATDARQTRVGTASDPGRNRNGPGAPTVPAVRRDGDPARCCLGAGTVGESAGGKDADGGRRGRRGRGTGTARSAMTPSGKARSAAPANDVPRSTFLPLRSPPPGPPLRVPRSPAAVRGAALYRTALSVAITRRKIGGSRHTVTMFPRRTRYWNPLTMTTSSCQHLIATVRPPSHKPSRNRGRAGTAQNSPLGVETVMHLTCRPPYFTVPVTHLASVP